MEKHYAPLKGAHVQDVRVHNELSIYVSVLRRVLQAAATHQYYYIARAHEVHCVLVASLRLRSSCFDNRPNMVLFSNRQTVKLIVTILYVGYLAFDTTEDKYAFQCYLLSHKLPLNLTQSIYAQCFAFFVCDETHGARMNEAWAMASRWQFFPLFRLEVDSDELVHAVALLIDASEADKLLPNQY